MDPIQLDTYDYVVAMDHYVAEHLRRNYRLSDGRLIEWRINDPYLKGRRVYWERARDIAEALLHLKDRLAVPKTRPSKAEFSTRSESAIVPSNLRADVKRWEAELDAGEIRDTLLQGIVKKAVDSFEHAFRHNIKVLCTLAREVEAPGKPFDRLTFGELIEYLAQRDRMFTAVCRRRVQDSPLLKNRRLQPHSCVVCWTRSASCATSFIIGQTNLHRIKRHYMRTVGSCWRFSPRLSMMYSLFS